MISILNTVLWLVIFAMFKLTWVQLIIIGVIVYIISLVLESIVFADREE